MSNSSSTPLPSAAGSNPIPPFEGRSDVLEPTDARGGCHGGARDFYLADYASAPPPVISSSAFVPRRMVAHLMRNKKNAALGVKFVSASGSDAITNMEGALHTFVTPLVLVKMHGDYAYRGMHTVEPFSGNQARRVVLSALVQPDFEGPHVMLHLAALQSQPAHGECLPDDFEVISVAEKQDETRRRNYDEALRRHMVFHLTHSRVLPGLSDKLASPTSERAAYTLLKNIAIGEQPFEAVRGVFVQVRTRLLSLEVLCMTAYHQLSNELRALEHVCAAQGYVYTVDPPSIFAKMLGGAGLLVRCQAAALRKFATDSPLRAMRAFAFNDYADREALPLFKRALPGVAVVPKASLFRGGENGRRYAPPAGCAGALLVLHNNSDAFGQNIETESSSGSMDGAIGCASSAAASLHRQHPRLLDFVMRAAGDDH